MQYKNLLHINCISIYNNFPMLRYCIYFFLKTKIALLISGKISSLKTGKNKHGKFEKRRRINSNIASIYNICSIYNNILILRYCKFLFLKFLKNKITFLISGQFSSLTTGKYKNGNFEKRRRIDGNIAVNQFSFFSWIFFRLYMYTIITNFALI